MTSRPVQAAVCAVWWAVAGCSDGPPQDTAPKKPVPLYSLERPTDALPSPAPRDDTFRRGVSLSVFGAAEPAIKPQYGKLLDDLVELGASDLELVVRWWQLDAQAVEMAPSAEDTVEDELLTWLMGEAKARGMRVVLTPLLEVEAEGHSRGSLAPSNWERWWWSYQRFITHYARLAGVNKAAALTIGAELTSTESQGERWTRLTKDLRKIYKGKLAYAVRYEQLDKLAFLDAIDLVSVTGGVEALRAGDEKDEELKQRLQRVAKQVRAWAMAHGKSYVLTDLGALAKASEAERRDSAALLSELRGHRALFEVWHDDPRFAGLFAGAWLGQTAQAMAPTVPKRPSAEVLRHWYRASRVAAQGSLEP